MISAIFILLLLALPLIQGETKHNRVIFIDVTGSDSPDCLLQSDISCQSLSYVLIHLQNSSHVNIRSKLLSLPRVVNLSNLNAITITGHGSTIVMYNNTGGVSCNNCSNVVIEGITWDQCGDPQIQDPLFGGVNFQMISNLVVQNCTFQHSKVRALSLLTPSGFVYVMNSYFVSNANYDTIFCKKVCGTTIHAATGGMLIKNKISATKRSEVDIRIDNCVFNNNGFMGNVKDRTTLSKTTRRLPFGAGLSILIINAGVLVNISIKSTTFSFNRGASGAGVRIYVKSINPSIDLTGLQFWNNSVINFYDNASALTVLQENYNANNKYAKQSLLNVSSCIFYGNHGGRNMVSYVVLGNSSNALITHCTFLNNWDYGSGLVELNIQSRSSLNISNVNFSSNTGRAAILHLHVLSINVTVSMFNINIERNFGSSVYKRGGVILLSISNDNSIIKLSKLNFSSNYFGSNGGGVYIFGTYQKAC